MRFQTASRELKLARESERDNHENAGSEPAIACTAGGARAVDFTATSD
jgi:hypothetical protein